MDIVTLTDKVRNDPDFYPYHEQTIETYCPKKRRQVKLTLIMQKKPKGEILQGKPTECDHEKICGGKEHSPFCLLKATQITTRRT